MKRRNYDWFDESEDQILPLLYRKNKAHNAHLGNPSSTILLQRWQQLRSEVQRMLNDLQNTWWHKKVQNIQDHADSFHVHQFYEAIKSIYEQLQRTTALYVSLMEVLPSRIKLKYFTEGQNIFKSC